MFNPSRCRIIAIGKIRKSWIKDGIKIYKKRLPNLTILELRDSDINKESNNILSSLRDGELLIALSEEGKNLNSLDFSNYLQKLGSQRLVFVIGGADGLSPKIKSTAHFCFSLSPLTFTHEMARLLLLEQLYRASAIAQGSPYHRQ